MFIQLPALLRTCSRNNELVSCVWSKYEQLVQTESMQWHTLQNTYEIVIQLPQVPSFLRHLFNPLSGQGAKTFALGQPHEYLSRFMGRSEQWESCC